MRIKRNSRRGEVSFLLSLILFHSGQVVTTPPKPEPITYIVTAYTAHCEGCSGIAANGDPPIKGVTIACPKSIELGTWLNIEDVGLRRCDDRGGAIKGNRLDLFIPRLDKALDFGVRDLGVEVLPP
jgi:3D (Asp-Asp-Asp) domain-containing protein